MTLWPQTPHAGNSFQHVEHYYIFYDIMGVFSSEKCCIVCKTSLHRQQGVISNMIVFTCHRILFSFGVTPKGRVGTYLASHHFIHYSSASLTHTRLTRPQHYNLEPFSCLWLWKQVTVWEIRGQSSVVNCLGEGLALANVTAFSMK